jgi:ferredoxin
VSTTFIAGGIAALLGIGLIIGLGVLSLLAGAFYFLFGKPKFNILMSTKGETGFAFGFRFDAAREPAKFDRFKIKMFNPFGKPTQVEVIREFDGRSDNFAEDIDLGIAYKELLKCRGVENATIQFEITAQRDGITHYFSMKAPEFFRKLDEATETAEAFNKKYKVVSSKPVYNSVKKSFVSGPLERPKNKVLAIATNPEFAAAFAGAGAAAGGGGAAAASNNFAVAKVWVEPGCIVCDACAGIFPEVFEVTSETSTIRPNAPLNDGLKIQEAAEACPVEVIKFTKA